MQAVTLTFTKKRTVVKCDNLIENNNIPSPVSQSTPVKPLTHPCIHVPCSSHVLPIEAVLQCLGQLNWHCEP